MFNAKLSRKEVCDTQRHLSPEYKSLTDDDVTRQDYGLDSKFIDHKNEIKRSTVEPMPSSVQAENAAKPKLNLAQLKNENVKSQPRPKATRGKRGRGRGRGGRVTSKNADQLDPKQPKIGDVLSKLSSKGAGCDGS